MKKNIKSETKGYKIPDRYKTDLSLEQLQEGILRKWKAQEDYEVFLIRKKGEFRRLGRSSLDTLH